MRQNADLFIETFIFICVILIARYLIVHMILKPSKFLKDLPKQDFSKGETYIINEPGLDWDTPEEAFADQMLTSEERIAQASTPDPAPELDPTRTPPKDKSIELIHVPDLSSMQNTWGAIEVVRIVGPFEVYIAADDKLRWRVVDPKSKAILLVSTGVYSNERTCINGIKSAKKSLLNPSKTVMQFEVKPTEAQTMLILLRANSSKVVASATTYSDGDAMFIIKRIKSLVKRMQSI